MNSIVLAGDHPAPHEEIAGVIASDGGILRHAPSDWRSTMPPNSPTEYAMAAHSIARRAAISDALAECSAAGIDLVSAAPEWVELRMPCDLGAIPALQNLLTRLDADLPQGICETINYACREMLSNAVEYGCRLDRTARVEVRFVRLKRAVICRIKYPGEGFDPTGLNHAAINNADDDPLQHVFVREEKGLRPGGFGILLTSQLVDELVYNEQHNELLFVKYLS
jgi:anti-sigma regulatory factor (Ser/Thr protein kinase)